MSRHNIKQVRVGGAGCGDEALNASSMGGGDDDLHVNKVNANAAQTQVQGQGQVSNREQTMPRVQGQGQGQAQMPVQVQPQIPPQTPVQSQVTAQAQGKVQMQRPVQQQQQAQAQAQAQAPPQAPPPPLGSDDEGFSGSEDDEDDDGNLDFSDDSFSSESEYDDHLQQFTPASPSPSSSVPGEGEGEGEDASAEASDVEVTVGGGDYGEGEDGDMDGDMNGDKPDVTQADPGSGSEFSAFGGGDNDNESVASTVKTEILMAMEQNHMTLTKLFISSENKEIADLSRVTVADIMLRGMLALEQLVKAVNAGVAKMPDPFKISSNAGRIQVSQASLAVKDTTPQVKADGAATHTDAGRVPTATEPRPDTTPTPTPAPAPAAETREGETAATATPPAEPAKKSFLGF